MRAMRAIGLMSGTSLDGVDAAWVQTDGERVLDLGPSLTVPYGDALRAGLRDLLHRAPALDAADPHLARLTARMMAVHRDAVRALGRAADLVGLHGQTILHRPEAGRTWQIGDAAWLARELGVPVAHDFRSADVAAGGQGAPLVPVFHAALAGALAKPLGILNVGGVANVTWLGADGAVAACDTGPGNALLDDWALRHTGQPCDRDGALALAGTVDGALLRELLADPYFGRAPPKSLDRLDFAPVLGRLAHLSAADGAATLVAFTAGAVAATRLPAPPVRWLVCGGGRHNPALMAALRTALPAPVAPVEAVGWDGDGLEAACFAHLAVRVLAGLPLSYPGTTGVDRPMPGGRISRP